MHLEIKGNLGRLPKKYKEVQILFLSFEDIVYEISIKSKMTESKKMINNISGYFKSDEITIIMVQVDVVKQTIITRIVLNLWKINSLWVYLFEYQTNHIYTVLLFSICNARWCNVWLSSGLDSTTIGVIIEFLIELANTKNMIIAFTIYQSSSNIFKG